MRPVASLSLDTHTHSAIKEVQREEREEKKRRGKRSEEKGSGS